MFRKMLVCSDLSTNSDALVSCASELTGIGLEEVVLIHVIYVSNTPGLEERLTEDARPVIERQKKALEEHGIRVTVEMPLGLPAQTLIETANKHDVSAILIGSRSGGILHAATLGSVSGKLLHETMRPVLLARDEVLKEGNCAVVCKELFSNILFPTDFSETAEKALDYLGKIALETGCRVTIMYSIDAKDTGPAGPQSETERASYLLDSKKRRLETLGAAEVCIFLAHGEPAKEIIRLAEKGAFSIIVMGGQGKGLLKEVFMGSVANDVARHAGVPLLLIPAER